MVWNHDEAPKKCYLCANSFVDDEDRLHCCTEKGNGKVVRDDESCDEWN